MKIAITTQGETTGSQVDPRFGRAAGFLIGDPAEDVWEYVPNTQNRTALQGAGIQAAQIMSQQEVECVITGHCGPKAFQAMQAAGIQVITGAVGPIDKVLERYAAGELVPADDADVAGHW